VPTLSNYLGSRGGSVRRAYGGAFPTVKRYTPYAPSYKESTREGVQPSFSDIGAALLQSRQQAKDIPSSVFQSNYDYDPITARIQALGSQSVANAATESSAIRRKAFVDTGDYDLAKSLGADESTLAAVKQNPDSMRAQLQAEFEKRAQDLEEVMNSQGLFYSGTYAHNLEDLAGGKRQAETSMGESLRGLLSGADQGLLSAEETARGNALEAARQAAMARQAAEAGGNSGGVGQMGTLELANTVNGWSDEQVYAAALANAPAGQYPGMVMNQGQVIYQNGQAGVMIKYRTPGSPYGNTIWVPLPSNAPAPTAPAPGDTTPPPPAPPEVSYDPATGAVVTNGPVVADPLSDPLSVYLGGRAGI
jgi:hypothetical protein